MTYTFMISFLKLKTLRVCVCVHAPMHVRNFIVHPCINIEHLEEYIPNC